MEFEEWLEQARTGELPEVPAELSRSIFGDRVKFVRDMVQPNDLDWVLENLTKYDDHDRAGFFPILVSNYSHDEEFAPRIRAHWDNANVVQKMKLSWRILDSPKLVDDWHKKIFSFVMDKWIPFNIEAMQFYGHDAHERMIRIVERYLSEQFTTKKGWMYICNAWYLRERYPAVSSHLVSLGQNSDVSFVRYVSHELESRQLGVYQD